jgi:hypothetical protein
MTLPPKVAKELKVLGASFAYFAAWLGMLFAIKKLLLAEYEISSGRFTVALIGALVLAKVVLILDHVPLGAWVRSRPAWIDVVLRTAIYTAGVFVVMIIEKSLEGRSEHGGLLPAMRALIAGAEARHVLVNTICVAGALLGYNVLAVIRGHLRPGGLLGVLMAPRSAADGEGQ